jgi:aryl-alcohol dehydrogenase-like predicted oxidoreductase
MEQRRLGQSGLTVAPLCLGAMNFGDPTDREESIRIIDAALDGGIDMIDTADVYSGGESEKIVGNALAANGRRDQIVLATKVGMMRDQDHGPDYWHRREHIVTSCDRSLESLRTDHIDLYQLHRPTFAGVPAEETLGAFDELVQAGKVLHVGCSTHPAWMVMEALAVAERDDLPRYTTEQPPYNLLDRRIENELLPLCEKHGLGVLPWSPLGAGILAGRYQDGIPGDARATRRPQMQSRITAEGRRVAASLAELASERELTAMQMALLWCKDQPGITAPIVGPRTLEQLEESLVVLDRTLDDDARAACDALVPPGNAVADFHNTSTWAKPLAAPPVAP